jgi:hypothetical protein
MQRASSHVLQTQIYRHTDIAMMDPSHLKVRAQYRVQNKYYPLAD